MPIHDVIHYIKTLISAAKEEMAIEILLSIIWGNAEALKILLVIKARLKRERDYQRQNIIRTKELNKITNDLLDYVTIYEKDINFLSIPELVMAPKHGEKEILLWNFTEIINKEKIYNFFLEEYPNSFFKPFAERAIDDIKNETIEGSVLVCLAPKKVERFKINTFTDFGHFTEIVFQYTHPYIKTNIYGKEWILKTVKYDKPIELKHGRIIVEDYHSPIVKDTRTLEEMGINNKTILTVEPLQPVSNMIYSNIIAEHERYICEKVQNLEGIPEDILISATQKIKEIKQSDIYKHHHIISNNTGCLVLGINIQPQSHTYYQIMTDQYATNASIFSKYSLSPFIIKCITVFLIIISFVLASLIFDILSPKNWKDSFFDLGTLLFMLFIAVFIAVVMNRKE